MSQQPPAYPPAGPPPPPTGRPATGIRSGGVTTAGVLLIILGAFAAIGGVLLVVSGAFLATSDVGEQLGGGFTDLVSAASGVAVVFGVVAIVYAVFKIIAGVRVMQLRNGWRIAGIVLTAIAILGWVLMLFGAFQGQQRLDPTTFEVTSGPSIGGIILALVFLAANTITLILLARSGREFAR